MVGSTRLFSSATQTPAKPANAEPTKKLMSRTFNSVMPKDSAICGSDTVAWQATPMRVRVCSQPSTPMIATVLSIISNSATLNCMPPKTGIWPCSGGAVNDRPWAPKTIRKISSAAMYRPIDAISATNGGWRSRGW